MSGIPQSRLDVKHYTWKDFCARFAPMLRPHRVKVFFSMACIGIVGLAVAVQPLFPKYVIDTAIPAKSLRLALAAAGVFLFSQFLRMGLWYVAMKGILQVQQSVVFQLRSRSFSHLQHLCLSFHSRFPSGFLYERVFGSSIGALGAFIQALMQGLALHVTGLFFSLIICFWFSPALTGVILVGAAAYVWAARLMAPRIYSRQEDALKAHMLVVGLIMDRLHGQKTIQAYSMEDRMQTDFDRKVWDAQVRWLSGIMENMKFSFVTEGIGYWLTAFVVVTGAWLIIGFQKPVGVLVAFIGYQAQLISVIAALSNLYGQFTTTRAAFDQLFTILDTRSDVEDRPGCTMIPEEAEEVRFDRVTFGYTPEKEVLKEVSFSLRKGEVVALAGRSGCGKTTAANLLLRFYHPGKGGILLNDRDIRELPLQEYRRLFSVVLQDPYLFDTTIRENLQMADPEASEEAMIRALQESAAWDFVKDLPGQLDFAVGEGGRSLSGGQRQRIAVARCMLLRSPFTILDEATSALDPESESLLQHSFFALKKERGVLIIAHRLNTLRKADRIVVLDQGRVAETGTYDELCRAGGLFAELNRIAAADEEKQERFEKAGFF